MGSCCGCSGAGHYAVVAEAVGRVVGSGFLYEGGRVAVVIIIGVDPAAQGHGIGNNSCANDKAGRR